MGDELMAYVHKDFRNALKERLNVQSLSFQNDGEDAKAFEFLIGRTNRPESEEFLATLRYNDYGYTVINQKIVIAGHTDETTLAAIALFRADVLGGTDEGGLFTIQQPGIYRATYATDNLLVGNLPVNGLKVIYPADNKYFEQIYAEKIALLLSETAGYYVPVYPDNQITVTDTDNLLLVGNTSLSRMPLPADVLTGDCYVGSNGNTVLVSGLGSLGIYGASDTLCDLIETSAGANITLPEMKFRADEDDVITIMSFNVWVGGRSDERNARVINMIERYAPDTFGVQEADHNWINTLNTAFSDRYDYVGIGRDGDTKGEYMAIFYLKDKYELLESGTKWLSDTPDEISKYEGSMCNRIATYAILQRKSDGKVFVHVNTHLDFGEPQTKQAKVLVGLTKQFGDLPVFITGDFNCEAGTASFKTITAAGFVPSSELAETANTGVTYHDYQDLTDAQYIIDICFVKPEKNMILTYRVCHEKINGDYASDHHPIITQILLP